MISGPKAAPDPSVSIIEIEIAGPAELGALPPPPKGPIIPQTEDGSITLRAVDAATAGKKVGITKGLISHFANTADSVTWRANIRKPGRFRVDLTYGVADSHAGSTLSLNGGVEPLSFVAQSTGGWRENKTRTVGELALPRSGEVELVLRVTKPTNNSNVSNIISIVLTPTR